MDQQFTLLLLLLQLLTEGKALPDRICSQCDSECEKAYFPAVRIIPETFTLFHYHRASSLWALNPQTVLSCESFKESARISSISNELPS